MPVDGSGTDEEIEVSESPKKDFESQLMAGCTTIVLSSLITYGLTVWPFLSLPEYSIVGLCNILLFGAVPATIFGVIVSRKFALAGAAGYFGGAMAGAVFMQIRLQQTMLARFVKDLPKPDYPESMAWIVPVSWFLFSALMAWIFCTREKPQG